MAETFTHRVWLLEDGNERSEGQELPREQLLREQLLREQPFTIQVRAGRQRRNAAETTRTPGHDYELAAGLLYAAGYIASRDDFAHMTYCVADAGRQEYNLLTVALHAPWLPALPRPEEVIVEGGSCGVSSDNLLAALAGRIQHRPPDFAIEPQALVAQAGRVAGRAAFFDEAGTLQAARVDVRPIQALDKLLGWALLEERLPLGAGVLWLPGPADYAMLERAVLAGVPIVASPGPPTSLAISAAHRQGIALLAMKGESIRVYSGRERLDTDF
jgi:FdhD protein